MNEPPLICLPDRIELFLQQQLTDDEQTAFEQHLDDCEDCRRQLEATAAAGIVWREVRDSLRDEPFSSASPSLSEAELETDTVGEASFSQTTVLKLLGPTDDDRMIGRLGAYEVVGVIGAGGMGVVLKAFDAALNRYVAIKVLAPHLGSSGAARKRFAREAQAAAAVVHDNVIEIHSVEDTAGLPYLVMPYVRGPSLQRRLDAEGPLAVVEILRIGMQAAAGLAAAHAQGLVHRDVKPANILLADGVERVKLTDFGLARAADDASLTKTGIIAGTPQYMSPEQARGESVDRRSDLFSLGSVLYAMCTGRAPFRAETSYGVLRRVTDEEPRPIRELNPDIPEWLCRIISRLMSKQPDERFNSADEVAHLLEKCLAHIQQPTAVPLPASHAPAPVSERPIPSLSRRSAGVLIMIAALGLGFVGLVLLGQALQDSDTGETPPTSQAGLSEPAPGQDDQSGSDRTEPPPTRDHRFTDLTSGNDVTVAFSADGQRIAIANGNPSRIMMGGGRSRVAGDWQAEVKILDAESGEILLTLDLTTADEDSVLAATARISHSEATALAFSPQGDLLAVGTSIGQVKFYDAQTGELVRSLDDEAAKLADEETPGHWMTLRRAMGNVTALAFSPDGALIATCGGSFADFAERFDSVSRLGLRGTGPGRLKVWEVDSGTLKHDLAGHNNHANAVTFSPNGQLLASAGRWLQDRDFGNGVILWNPHSGNQIRSFRITASGGTRSVAFSPDSRMLAIGTQRFDDSRPGETSTGGVSLVHVASGTTEWLVTVPGWARPVTFTPDGDSVVVLCGRRAIRFLDTHTGNTKQEIQPDEASKVRWYDCELARRSSELAIGGVNNEKNGSVEVWSMPGAASSGAPAATVSRDTTDDTEATPFPRFETGMKIGTVACSRDGKLIAVGNASPTMRGGRVADNWQPRVKILNGETGETVVTLELTTAEEDAVLAETERVSHFQVTSLAFSPDGSMLAVGTSIGQVKLYDTGSGGLEGALSDEAAGLDEETPEQWQSLSRAMGSVVSLDFSPDGSLLATCGKSFADFSDIFDGVERLGELATGPGRLKVWDTDTGTLRHDLAGHSHAREVAFSPDGDVMVSVGNWLDDSSSGTGAILWNAGSGERLGTIGMEANGGAQSLAFSPDGKLLVVRALQFNLDDEDDRGTDVVSMARLASGVLEWRRTVPGSANLVAFFSAGNHAVAVCGEQSIRYLETSTGRTLAILSRSADMPPVGRWAAFTVAKGKDMLVIGEVDGESNGTVVVWDFDG